MADGKEVWKLGKTKYHKNLGVGGKNRISQNRLISWIGWTILTLANEILKFEDRLIFGSIINLFIKKKIIRSAPCFGRSVSELRRYRAIKG